MGLKKSNENDSSNLSSGGLSVDARAGYALFLFVLCTALQQRVDDELDRSDGRVANLQCADAHSYRTGGDGAVAKRAVSPAEAGAALGMAVYGVVLGRVDCYGLLYGAVSDADEQGCQLLHLCRSLDGDTDIHCGLPVCSDQSGAVVHDAARDRRDSG